VNKLFCPEKFTKYPKIQTSKSDNHTIKTS
jgi:hypothetical protein